MTEEQQHEFINKLTYKKANTSFVTFVYRHLTGGDDMSPPSLTDLLMIDPSLLTEEGKEAIDYLESVQEPEGQIFSFEKFKWKVMAFLSVQDLLSIPIFSDGPITNILQIKYFYYESKYILTEMIVSSLNGLHIANKQLMRNFLEFNLQQCYFINKIHKEYSYQSFNEYLKTRISPGKAKLINGSVPDDNFCKAIKKRIQLELDNLSSRYSHAYNQDESPKHHGIFRPGLTIESIYFYVQATVTLDVVLWTYYVNFPMLFKPVNIVQKFGFSPPALFVTPDVTSIIKKTMSQDDFTVFEKYATECQFVKDNLEWYDSSPDLTEEQIWAMWDKPKEEHDTIESCFLKTMTTVRAYSELLFESEKMKEERLAKEEAVDETFVENYAIFSKWQKAYKNVRK